MLETPELNGPEVEEVTVDEFRDDKIPLLEDLPVVTAGELVEGEAAPVSVSRARETDPVTGRMAWDEGRYPQGCVQCRYWEDRGIPDGVCRDCGRPFKAKDRK